jgi:hypothetical protein
MKNLTLSFLAAALVTLAAADDLKPIFNGKDLSGWDAPEGNIWFTVEEGGVLKVQNGPGKKGKTLWTTKEYADFAIEFDFKMGAGTVDSGIYIRNEKEQIQIGISGSLKRDMTASPYIPGKGYPVEAEGVKELLKAGDWNTMRIEARGKDYVTWLNGKKVMSYTSESAIEKGKLGIQLHGGREMTIEYRNLKAADLK